MLGEGYSNYISILLPRQRHYFTGCKNIQLAELREKYRPGMTTPAASLEKQQITPQPTEL